MRIKTLIDELIKDLKDYRPSTLSQMACDVRDTDLCNSIGFLVKNSRASADYMKLKCYSLLKSEGLDTQLACLLVIASDTNDRTYDNLMSSASTGSDEYYWSRAMASSSLFNKASNEKLRITS